VHHPHKKNDKKNDNNNDDDDDDDCNTVEPGVSDWPIARTSAHASRSGGVACGPGGAFSARCEECDGLAGGGTLQGRDSLQLSGDM